MSKFEEEILLSRLKLKLCIDSEDIGYNSGSLFQGVLMEKIDSDYAFKLHNLEINPYSQFIKKSSFGTFWCISATNEEAYQKIISPLLKLDKIFLEKKNLEIKISEKKLERISRSDFVEKNLFKNSNERIIFNFLTPTAFKRDNRYIIIPEPYLIFQNLMRKFDSTGKDEIFSPELLEEIKSSVFISKYNLKSVLFYLEKTIIPGFLGSLEISTKTNKDIANILRLLNAFSEFSGTGIKCSIGMGGTLKGDEKLE